MDAYGITQYKQLNIVLNKTNVKKKIKRLFKKQQRAENKKIILNKLYNSTDF